MNFSLDYVEKRIIINAFFCTAFIISNLITIKVVNLNFHGMEVTAGVLIYPLVYILINVITDVYGENAAHRTMILGLATDVLFVLMTTLILFLPSPVWYTGDSSLAFVFTQTPKILIAAYISYLLGNLTNARLTAIFNRNDDSYSAFKNLAAIAIGEFVDNAFFIFAIFIFSVPIKEIVIMIVCNQLILMAWNVVAEPFTKRLVLWAKES